MTYHSPNSASPTPKSKYFQLLPGLATMMPSEGSTTTCSMPYGSAKSRDIQRFSDMPGAVSDRRDALNDTLTSWSSWLAWSSASPTRDKMARRSESRWSLAVRPEGRLETVNPSPPSNTLNAPQVAPNTSMARFEERLPSLATASWNAVCVYASTGSSTSPVVIGSSGASL